MSKTDRIRFMIAAVIVAAAVLASPGIAGAAKVVPPSPVITGLSQYNGAPGTVVTISGTGFGAQKRDSIVWFNGVSARFTAWDDTVIQFKVPDGVGAGYVGVQNDAGTSNGFYFVPFDAPTVTSVSHSIQQVGLDITINGSGFETAQGDGYVSFNGTSGVVRSWTATQVVVTVPSGATAGYVGIVQHGISSNGTLFTPYYQPVVTGLSTGYALIGDTITITGTDFGATPQQVVLKGVRYSAQTWSDTQITFKVPAGAASGYCGVLRDGRISNGKYLFVAPRVSGLSSWWAGHGTHVTVSGIGFGSAPGSFRLLFGGQEVTADSWSDTSVVFTVPAGAPSGYVGFTDSLKAATSNGIWLLVVDSANISSVASVAVQPGQAITINGTNFGLPSAQSQVRLSGTVLEIVSWTDTQIVAYAPASSTYGYLGVWKSGVASNGILVSVAPSSITPAVQSGASKRTRALPKAKTLTQEQMQSLFGNKGAAPRRPASQKLSTVQSRPPRSAVRVRDRARR